ncbi:hypothetical protein FOPG_16265 [Fusarium oxysporum f. sp. conglutinans race 2 54008]|uniref:Uncharacterized protein n=1 Tax=Fusarium oxysporum f. sp. conglutinans race 2 54008 TaxID=1089457 RepID=X0GVD8_FUSOX|nr:hypothetical protein FOPG_16265 [Fusarium oxysporum f. sp. conglutinans race 2 54008]KAG6981858.1 hypothetical protein FocnCong_v007751 [Fusarium oxysporum f. sp. conglutinans]
MESMREELFPIQQGTDIHRFIMDSHEKSLRDEVNARVSRMTPNAEKITGKPGFGGINVIGGLTSSSVSTKSLATAHCGAWPMAVNMFEEAVVESYQPCIPQVLELFNTLKGGNNTKDAKYPAFFQAVTDTYDRQDIFDSKIGFKYIFTKGKLDKEAHDKPEMEKINYFGYPETDLKEHIKKFITNGLANNQRLFISHFTSTTYHPWDIPTWFETEKYMGKEGKRHQDFNKYLNTVRFIDAWGHWVTTFLGLGLSFGF